MNHRLASSPARVGARRANGVTRTSVIDILNTATFGSREAGPLWHPACYGLCTLNALPAGKRRIALLDDHPIILFGVASTLTREQDFKIVGTYGHSRALIEGLATRPAEVIVIDYALSREDLDGAALIRTLLKRVPGARLIVYSAHYEPSAVASALRNGARGFVGKTQATERLAIAIRAVSNGEVFVDADMAFSLMETTTAFRQSNTDVTPPIPTEVESIVQGAKLSPRERDVIRCFLNGMTVGEIAKKFDRSAKTISTQKFTAYRKLGVRSDNGLFKIARLLGDL